MTLIFCQDCFESTGRKLDLSIHEMNTNGNCSKCDSSAVISESVVAGAGAVVVAPDTALSIEAVETHGTWNTRHGIAYNTDYIQTSRVRDFLLAENMRSEATWWDGSYFEYRMHFLLYQTPGFELLLENIDGEQRRFLWKATLTRESSPNAQQLKDLAEPPTKAPNAPRENNVDNKSNAS